MIKRKIQISLFIYLFFDTNNGIIYVHGCVGYSIIKWHIMEVEWSRAFDRGAKIQCIVAFNYPKGTNQHVLQTVYDATQIPNQHMLIQLY
jgi:hypothetical protein